MLNNIKVCMQKNAHYCIPSQEQIKCLQQQKKKKRGWEESTRLVGTTQPPQWLEAQAWNFGVPDILKCKGIKLLVCFIL